MALLTVSNFRTELVVHIFQKRFLAGQCKELAKPVSFESMRSKLEGITVPALNDVC